MVKIVIVKVVRLVSVLLVNVVEVLLPRYFGDFLCVQINPDKSIDIDLDVNAEETVLVFVDAVRVFESSGLGQFTIQTVGPAMIPARQNLRVSRALFLNYWIRTVSANVVESVDISLSITGNNEVEASHLVSEPVASFLDARAVGEEDPPLGEDCTTLQLIHLWRCVP